MTAQWTHPLPVPPPDGPPGRGSGRDRREGWGCDDPVASRAMAREREAIRWTDRQPRPGHGPAGTEGTGRCSAWLAAYALGLAHTNSSPDTCVSALSTSADGCTDLLQDARAHLATMTDMDDDLRIRAGRLLTTAAAVSDDGGSAAVSDGT